MFVLLLTRNPAIFAGDLLVDSYFELTGKNAPSVSFYLKVGAKTRISLEVFNGVNSMSLGRAKRGCWLSMKGDMEVYACPAW